MMKRKTAVIFGIIIAAQLCLTPYAGVKVQAAELEEGQMFEDSSEDSETFGDVSIPDAQSAEKTEENEFGDDDGFGIDNLVRLEAKMANMEGAVSVTIRDLIKSALRMRPDRIIVGEVRGGEAMDMLQALNTGHEGSLSTAHANSARDMLSRLETMVLMGVDLPLEAIRRQIASGVDILVHLGRMRDKSRKLLEVTEVCGFENGEIRIRPLYQWQEGKGLVKTASLLHVEKLERAGIEL